MIWLSIDVCFKWLWLSVDLNFKWCGSNWFEIQVIRLSIRFQLFGCQSFWDSNELVVNWCVIQVIWLSIDLRFKWFGCRSLWDSNELVVNWFEIQMISMSNDLRFKWFGCQLMRDSNDFVKRSFSARLPSKLKLWSSKTKLLRETSFKNEAFKIKNEAFLRDFLQKWSFEVQNEAFLRDFLQNWSFEAQKRSFCARLPWKMNLWRSKTKHFCETSFKNDKLTRHLTSEFQYVLTIFKWMLQKHCACRKKVEPRHTKSCNCYAKWSLQSNTSVTWNL